MSIISDLFVRGHSIFDRFACRRIEVESALKVLLADHSNFLTILLPAVCASSQAHLLISAMAPQSEEYGTHPKKIRRKRRGLCQLPKLCGLESSVIVQVADFIGIARGRQLRNLREAYVCLSDENFEFDSDTEDYH